MYFWSYEKNEKMPIGGLEKYWLLQISFNIALNFVKSLPANKYKTREHNDTLHLVCNLRNIRLNDYEHTILGKSYLAYLLSWLLWHSNYCNGINNCVYNRNSWCIEGI